MANLVFVEVPTEDSFKQVWKAEADDMQWKIGCGDLDQDGLRGAYTILRRQVSGGAYSAAGRKLKLADAKRFACDRHDKEAEV